MKPIKLANDKVVKRGEGNHVSVEFNLLYRVSPVCGRIILDRDRDVMQWHTTLSAADEKWTEEVFSRVFHGKPFDQVSSVRFGQTDASYYPRSP
jgi:hypothetical protein